MQLHVRKLLLILTILFLVIGCGQNRTTIVELTPETESPTDSKPLAIEDFIPPNAEESAALKNQINQIQTKEKAKRRTYVIGPEDVLRIKVWMRDDISKEGPVRDDGMFFVPLAGNVKAEGLTLSEFQKLLTEKLAQYIRNPQVDVEITAYQSKMFYIVGEVNSPGMYPIKGTTTVMEAVAQGKGFSEKANLGQARLIHNETLVPIDFVGLFQKGKLDNNLFLNHGDVIYVPSIEIARVYVLGEVNRPTAVPVRGRSISLAQAIADAGGFDERTAFTSAIRIIRGNLADPTVYTVNFKKIMKGDDKDLAFLKPGDIVYVPASGLAKWDRVMGQLLPNLSRIVVDAAAIDSLTK